MGNKLSATDGENHTTQYAYDGDSRLTGVSQAVGTHTLTTSYTYDIEEGGYIKNSVTDAEGHVTQTWFDTLGHKVKDLNAGDTGDSAEILTGYAYDANGQVTLVTRNDSTKEKYTYDCLGRNTRVDYYEAAENPANPSDDYIVYEYNANGQLTLSSSYRSSTQESTAYSYDNMGRACQIVEGDLQNGGLSVNYTYDNANRVTQINYSKDNTLRKLGYAYDAYGRIWKITLALGTDPADTIREYVYKTNGDLDHV
ncbi:MAG: hypothetical protein VB070_07825, partial [Clostridiaceae bacterium]|nr:hypothetical protein [Clostridiaceae bacterium]